MSSHVPVVSCSAGRTGRRQERGKESNVDQLVNELNEVKNLLTQLIAEHNTGPAGAGGNAYQFTADDVIREVTTHAVNVNPAISTAPGPTATAGHAGGRHPDVNTATAPVTHANMPNIMRIIKEVGEAPNIDAEATKRKRKMIKKFLKGHGVQLTTSGVALGLAVYRLVEDILSAN